MTLAEFKSAFNVTKIDLFKSNSSNRLVGSFMHNDAEQRIVTTETFNASAPVHVYPTDVVNEETGEVTKLYVFSNKSATPALTL